MVLLNIWNIFFLFLAIFSQLSSFHIPHFSIPRISSPTIFYTLNPISHFITHMDPKKVTSFPRSQSAENHSSSSWSPSCRQLPVIPSGNKFPPVIHISKAQLQQVIASSFSSKQLHCWSFEKLYSSQLICRVEIWIICLSRKTERWEIQLFWGRVILKN